MICPVCGQEGQRINCISGTKSEVVVYHPKKILQNICNIVSRGDTESTEEVHEQTVLPGLIGERSAED